LFNLEIIAPTRMMRPVYADLPLFSTINFNPERSQIRKLKVGFAAASLSSPDALADLLFALRPAAL
jgi:hypothetical protein